MYESLSKVYYKNFSQHKKIYEERFNSPTVEHFGFVIKQFNRQKDFPAFLCYTKELFLLMETVYKKYARFLQTFNNIPAVIIHQFARSCIIDEIKSTNDIEGVRSSRLELKEIMEGKARDSRFTFVVKKYMALLKIFLFGLAKTSEIFTTSLLKVK